MYTLAQILMFIDRVILALSTVLLSLSKRVCRLSSSCLDHYMVQHDIPNPYAGQEEDTPDMIKILCIDIEDIEVKPFGENLSLVNGDPSIMVSQEAAKKLLADLHAGLAALQAITRDHPSGR